MKYQRSSYCWQNGCVEVAAGPEGIYVRDSKDGKDPCPPAHVFTVDEWDAFIAGVKDGEFDSAKLVEG